MMFTFLPRTISKRWSRIRTDIEDVRELTKREDRTIPVRNQTMPFDRPMIFLGYSVVGIADGKNINILHKILLEKGTMYHVPCVFGGLGWIIVHRLTMAE